MKQYSFLLEAKRIDLVKLANKDMSKRDILRAVKGFRKITKTDYGPAARHKVYAFKHLSKQETPYTLSDVLAQGKSGKDSWITRSMINYGTPKK